MSKPNTLTLKESPVTWGHGEYVAKVGRFQICITVQGKNPDKVGGFTLRNAKGDLILDGSTLYKEGGFLGDITVHKDQVIIDNRPESPFICINIKGNKRRGI